MRLNKLVHAALALAVFALSALALSSQPVRAHGERAQEPFLRMRSVQWYDLKWEPRKVAVNDTVTVSGKFRFMPASQWPLTLAKPETGFLNISHPGPVFVRTASFIDGVNAANSTKFELGRNYAFEVKLKARYPGTWHVHTMMNILHGGALVGPGQWITVTGSHADFTNPVTTLTGETYDLDTYGLANSLMWHGIWLALGAVWLMYWLTKRLFFSRSRMVQAGRAEELVTGRDRIVSFTMLAVTVGLVIGGYIWAESKWPITLPLQSARQAIPPLPDDTNKVKVELERATYRVPGRALKMKIKVTNTTNTPVRLGEFTTATVRFINPVVGPQDDATKSYPDDLRADEGLTVSDNTPIAPGETRTLELTAQDAAWETERLSSLIYDPDSRFGGLLFFYGADGSRQISDVGGVTIPQFI